MTAFGELCCRVNNSIHTLPDSLVDRGMRQGDINTPLLFCLISPKKRSCVFLIQSVFNHERITEVSPVTCLQTELKYQFQLLFKNSWISGTVFASLPSFLIIPLLWVLREAELGIQDLYFFSFIFHRGLRQPTHYLFLWSAGAQTFSNCVKVLQFSRLFCKQLANMSILIVDKCGKSGTAVSVLVSLSLFCILEQRWEDTKRPLGKSQCFG